jgi:ribonuclease HI
MAEYHVIIGLLIKASSLGITCLIINLDSQLMVCHLNQDYVIRNPVLLHLHLRVNFLERSFEFLQYRHISRKINTTSDSLANYMLDHILRIDKTFF